MIYHVYCMGLPANPFRKFFSAVGAVSFGHFEYRRPAVIVTAEGCRPEVASTLETYLAEANAADYPSDAPVPPWGDRCDDPRVLDDEDNSAWLHDTPHTVEFHEGGLRATLKFQNTFAGPLAFEKWLRSQGLQNITISLAPVEEVLEPTAERHAPQIQLFPSVVSKKERYASLSPAELIRALLDYHASAPQELREAVGRIPVDQRLSLASERVAELRQQHIDPYWQALLIMEEAGLAAADWLRELWPTLLARNFYATGVAVRVMRSVLPKEEAFTLALQWLDMATDRKQYFDRLQSISNLKNPRTAELIEKWWRDAAPGEAIADGWSRIAVESQVGWPTLRGWIESGRPLSLVALTALSLYARQESMPDSFDPPAREVFVRVLTQYKQLDSAPRSEHAVNQLLQVADRMTRP